MSQVTASLVKELRDRTGLGMMECKRALAQSEGDIDKAIEDLRKSSGMKAAKKAGRTAADGVVAFRAEGGYGLVLEVNSETDFVARDAGFQGFVNTVLDAAYSAKQTDVAALMAGGLETERQELVQKIGENISPRRIDSVEAPVVGGYVHSNSRIAVLVGLSGGSEELAKEVAMHVAAVNPAVVNSDDMPADLVALKKKFLRLKQEKVASQKRLLKR